MAVNAPVDHCLFPRTFREVNWTGVIFIELKEMLTTLRAFNSRATGARKAANSDVTQSRRANATSSPATVHFEAYSKNSRKGRMIDMAQTWKKQSIVSQLEHSLRHHPLPGLHMRSVHTSSA